MITRILFYTLLVSLGIILIPRLVTSLHAIPLIFSYEEVEPAPVAIVFGAGLWRDGSPTPVLRDRVETAANLYFAGKVSKLLLSGDNRFIDYNEPEAMRTYALELGVPDDAIVLDFAGRRTYDTCYRAKDIFGLDSVILVTQGFHLPRALYTCNKLDLNASGVPANQREYRRRSLTYWQLRETLATCIALWEIHITHPQPVLGTPEPIFFSIQNQKQSGDET